MAGTYPGRDPEHFQKIMGRGGVISSRPKQEQPETPPSAKQVATGSQSEIHKELAQIYLEAQESGNVAFPSGKTAESKSTTGEASDVSGK